MPVQIKFCGLTRPEDARAAVALGASYTGVILAGGPRTLTPERAAETLADVPAAVRRVGVFATAVPDEVARAAAIAGLRVAQLHGDPDAAAIERLRSGFAGEIWGVVRVGGSLPEGAATLFRVADAVLLDARVDGRLGGSGVAFDWSALAGAIARARGKGRARFVLAGGLTPDNVAAAIRALDPDVVDVSSGVERAPGIKDPARMRAFAAAVGVTRNDE